MKPFDAARRDLLRLGSMGLAASSLPAFAATTNPAPDASHEAIFNVRMYGATGDGKTVDSAAINKAIEAAAAAGGGTVVVPAGTYVCFSIRLKSHVGLYLSHGSTIVAADSPKPGETTGYNGGVYDAAEPLPGWDAYQDFGHSHTQNSLIWGEGLTDVSITGPGLIYGKGLSMGESGNRGGYVQYTMDQPGVGNKSIALRNCRNVVFRDFSMLKTGHLGLLITGVDNVLMDNITMDTDRGGIDISCCRNVTVTNCNINSPWDDAICLKSSLALGYLRDTQNVTISNCVVSGSYVMGTVLDGTFKVYPPDPPGTRIGRLGRIKLGTESNGGFKNIAITNCMFDGCMGLAIETADGARVEDIVVSNLTMRDVVNCPIFLRLGARLRGPLESTKPGTLKRVLISNVCASNSAAGFSSILSGIPGHAIEDVKIADVYVEHVGGGTTKQAALRPLERENIYPEPRMFGDTPSHGFYVRHVNRLEMSHVEIAPKAADVRPAFYLEDVHRADFIAVTAPSPAFSLNAVTDLRILLSRAAPDTTLSSVDSKVI